VTAKELAASASGEVHFNWSHGSIIASGTAAQESVRFDAWRGTASIQGGNVEFGENELVSGRRSNSVTGTIRFGGSPRLSIEPATPKLAAVSVPPSK